MHFCRLALGAHLLSVLFKSMHSGALQPATKVDGLDGESVLWKTKPYLNRLANGKVLYGGFGGLFRPAYPAKSQILMQRISCVYMRANMNFTLLYSF